MDDSVVVLVVVVAEPLRLRLVPYLVPGGLLKSYSMKPAFFWVVLDIPWLVLAATLVSTVFMKFA